MKNFTDEMNALPTKTEFDVQFENGRTFGSTTKHSFDTKEEAVKFAASYKFIGELKIVEYIVRDRS
jgi:hypothetical protein